MNRGVWQAIALAVAKLDMTERLSLLFTSNIQGIISTSSVASSGPGSLVKCIYKHNLREEN